MDCVSGAPPHSVSDPASVRSARGLGWASPSAASAPRNPWGTCDRWAASQECAASWSHPRENALPRKGSAPRGLGPCASLARRAVPFTGPHRAWVVVAVAPAETSRHASTRSLGAPPRPAPEDRDPSSGETKYIRKKNAPSQPPHCRDAPGACLYSKPARGLGHRRDVMTSGPTEGGAGAAAAALVLRAARPPVSSAPVRSPAARPLAALPRPPRRHGPAPAAPPGRGQLRRGAKMGEDGAGPERQPQQPGRPARARPRHRGDARARRRALSAFVCRLRPPHH
ncbi:hypothetical protein H8959_010057 [Pygathrix nigripes]